MQLSQLVTPDGGPVVVAVLRQQLAAVDRQGSSIGAARPHLSGVSRRLLEAVDVDLGDQPKHLVADLDRIGTESPSRHVYRLMKIVQRRHRVTVPPQHVHHLLAVEPMARGEGEQLHQFAGLAQAPRALSDLITCGGREPTKEPHFDRRHPPRMPDRAGIRHHISTAERGWAVNELRHAAATASRSCRAGGADQPFGACRSRGAQHRSVTFGSPRRRSARGRVSTPATRRALIAAATTPRRRRRRRRRERSGR